ncbi:hypothetical protein [Pseudoalteromonas mariniglutinosa]|uniref:hypothetical protein n=1 Tax=Pseudoalteromonas mariniglutinosa TaxID=206042 RepID=UPI00384F1058
MPFEVNNYLLVDIDSAFSRAFTEHYFAKQAQSTLIAAGSNTRYLVKLMFDELIKDYCYCDFNNEISVSELASYLHEHHEIKGVLINQTDYQLADDNQKFIFNSLHAVRILVQQDENGFNFTPAPDPAHTNHLSCHTDIAQTTADVLTISEHLNKK